MIRVGIDPENNSRMRIELEGKPFELIEEVNALLNDMCRGLTNRMDKVDLACRLAFVAHTLKLDLDTEDEFGFGYKELRKRLRESFTKQLAEAVAKDAES